MTTSNHAPTVLRAQGVSKIFKVFHNTGTGPLLEKLFPWRAKHYYREFPAVKDVSFEVKKGEVLGIIGPNGAGKTTLLKILAGLLSPSQGTVEVHGKITALLALGVGIHPEFTGRENAIYSGMLLGLSRAEILAKLDDIIAFSELGDYIDRPFRTYSSGMKARLLFATSLSISPDILIVDEALSTGDIHFVKKCKLRIRELCTSGATILYVSHNLSEIKEICNRVMLIADGELKADGDPDHVLSLYHELVFEMEKNDPIIQAHQGLRLLSGTGQVELEELKLISEEGQTDTGFYTGHPMIIELSYINHNPKPQAIDLFIGFIQSKTGQFISEVTSKEHINPNMNSITNTKLHLQKKGKIRIEFKNLLLLTDHYSLWLMAYQHDSEKILFEYREVGAFFVSRRKNSISRDASSWHPANFSTIPDLEVEMSNANASPTDYPLAQWGKV